MINSLFVVFCQVDLCQLIHCQDGVDGLAHATIQGGTAGIILGHERHKLCLHLGREATGYVQIQ